MRPPEVTKDFLHPPLVPQGKIHPPGAAVDVPELQAGLADRGIVHDGQESDGVGHQHLVEQRLVGIKKPDEVDVAFQVSRLRTELLHHAADLDFLRVHPRGKESRQAQRLALSFAEGCGFVGFGVAQHVESATPADRFFDFCHCTFPLEIARSAS